MANPVMNRASDSTGLNLLPMLQNSPPAGGMNGGFSGALEQSLRDQQTRGRQADEMRQTTVQRPEAPKKQQTAERATDAPQKQDAAERAPERTGPDTVPPARSEKPTQASEQSESSSEAASSAASAQTEPSKPASDKADRQDTHATTQNAKVTTVGPSTPTTEDPGTDGDMQSAGSTTPGNPSVLATLVASLESASKNTAENETVQTTGTPAAIAEEQAAITAAPANLAVLATIIAALEKGGPGQRLQATATADPGDIKLDAGLGKSLGTAIAELLGRQSTGAGSGGLGGGPDGGEAELDQGAIVQAAKQLKGDILATQAGVAKFSTQVAQTLTAQVSAAQPGAYGMTPAAALGATEGPTSLTPSQPGMIPGLRSEAASQLPQLQVATPAGQRAWAEDVGNKMLWMVGRGESRAELVLTPPSLGKLGVSIQVSGDHTTAQFVTSTAAARDALEQAMPRLRELLQQAGINLGQADVSTSSERHTPGDERSSTRSGSGFGQDQGASVETELPGLSQGGSWTRTGLGVIDTFA